MRISLIKKSDETRISIIDVDEEEEYIRLTELIKRVFSGTLNEEIDGIFIYIVKIKIKQVEVEFILDDMIGMYIPFPSMAKDLITSLFIYLEELDLITIKNK